MAPVLRRALHSRALHFLVLGAAVFAFAPRRDDPSKVTLSSRDLGALHAAQASRLGVTPSRLTASETAEIDARAIEDNVLYREALRLGLDRDDVVVRQHLVQKMLLLPKDLGGATRTPTEKDLRDYYEATRARWTRDANAHFIHVFASRHDAIVALERDVSDAAVSPPRLGDAFPASRDVTSPQNGIAGVYGDSFANAVFAQDIGIWGEPVESKFGWHLVKVLSRDEGHPASFEEVRSELALEWQIAKRHEATAAFLARAFARYDVRVDGARIERLPNHTPRLARRLDPSAED